MNRFIAVVTSRGQLQFSTPLPCGANYIRRSGEFGARSPARALVLSSSRGLASVTREAQAKSSARVRVSQSDSRVATAAERARLKYRSRSRARHLRLRVHELVGFCSLALSNAQLERTSCARCLSQNKKNRLNQQTAQARAHAPALILAN